MFHPLSHTPTALPSAPLETTASFSTSVYLTLFHLSPVPHGGRIVIRDVTSCSCLVSNSKMFLRLGHLAIKDRRFSLEDWLVFNRSYVIMFSPFIHSFIYHSSFMLSLVTRFRIFAVVNRRLDILLEIRDFISCGKAKSMVILFLIDFHKDYIKLYYLQEHTGLLCECLTPSPPLCFIFGVDFLSADTSVSTVTLRCISASCFCCSCIVMVHLNCQLDDIETHRGRGSSEYTYERLPSLG